LQDPLVMYVNSSAWNAPPPYAGSKYGGVVALVLALGLGIGLGVLAGYDPVWSPHHPLWSALTGSSLRTAWLWTASAVVVLVGTMVFLSAGSWMFANRDRLAVVFVIVSLGLTGIAAGPLDPSDLALVVVVLLWCSMALVEHRTVHTPKLLMVVMLCLAATGFASIVNGQTTTIFRLQSLFARLVMLFLVTNLLVTRPLHQLALRTFLWVAGVSAVIAILSELLFVGTGLRLTMERVSLLAVKDTPVGPLLRATAFMPVTQSLGNLLLMALGITLFGNMRSKKRIAFVMLLFGGVCCTVSIGAVLTGTIIIAIAIFMRRPTMVLHLVLLLATALLLAYVSGFLTWLFTDFFIEFGADQARDRIGYIQEGLVTISRFPVFGVGYGNILRVQSVEIHNVFMQVMSETGVISGILYIVMLACLLGSCVMAIRRATCPDDTVRLKGILLGIIALSLYAQMAPFYSEPSCWVFFGIVVSGVSLYGRRDENLSKWRFVCGR